MSLCLCVFMHTYLKRENARRDAAMIARGLTLNSYTEEMKYAERERGDNASVSTIPLLLTPFVLLIFAPKFFRYTV